MEEKKFILTVEIYYDDMVKMRNSGKEDITLKEAEEEMQDYLDDTCVDVDISNVELKGV